MEPWSLEDIEQELIRLEARVEALNNEFVVPDKQSFPADYFDVVIAIVIFACFALSVIISNFSPF